MNRRRFLTVSTTLGAASLILDSCGKPDQKIIPLLVPEEELQFGDEQWVSTLCQLCPAGCGISVRVMPGGSIRQVDGQAKKFRTRQAKKIEGNPAHPLNQGKTCALGQAGVQIPYHPDRLQSALLLPGKRGSGEYQSISWESALNLAKIRLQELQAKGVPLSLGLAAGDTVRGTMKSVLRNFAQCWGTTRICFHEPGHRWALKQAASKCLGIHRLPVLDLANSRIILSVGADILETHHSPVYYNRAYGEFRRSRAAERGRFVYAGPRLSATAANADQWIPIRPGREQLFLRTLAAEIVGGGNYDHDFIDYQTDQFETWSQDLANETVNRNAGEIGIPASSLVKLAADLIHNQPALILAASPDPEVHTTVLALNALLGNYGRSGGILAEPLPTHADSPLKDAEDHFPGLPLGDTGGVVEQGPSNKDGSPIQILLMYDAVSLFFSSPESTLQARLRKIPFIIGFSSFLDEAAREADLILPIHTFLERWGDDVPEPGPGITVRTLSQPVIKPRFDTRCGGDLILEIAQSLGGKFPALFPRQSFEDLVRESFSKSRAENALEIKGPEPNRFWEEVKVRGGYWHGEKENGFDFATANGKFHFPETLNPGNPLLSEQTPGEDLLFLHLYETINWWDGRGANLPWMHELPEIMTTIMWNGWIELHPDTAARLEINQGDLVEVSSLHGKIQLPAYLHPALRPDTAAIPLGQGRKFGSYAQGRGENPLNLSNPTESGLEGSGLVRLKKMGKSFKLATFGASTQIAESLKGNIG